MSGSEGSKELPVNLATLQINHYILEANQDYFFYDTQLIFYIILPEIILIYLLGGNTLLTPPVADTKSIGYIHSKCITFFHDNSNVTHHTHSV